jgi:hypothetical protein
MTTLHKRGFLAAMAVAIPAMLIGSGLSAPPAQAGSVVTLAQQGSDVIANGSGPLDLTGLSSAGGGSNGSGVGPSSGTILTGPVSAFEDTYEGLITGPRSFGSGGFTDANSGSGSFVGIVGFVEPFGGFADFLEVPRGYIPAMPCRTPRHMPARPSAPSA